MFAIVYPSGKFVLDFAFKTEADAWREALNPGGKPPDELQIADAMMRGFRVVEVVQSGRPADCAHGIRHGVWCQRCATARQLARAEYEGNMN